MKSKQDLKSFFENGDRPNQEQFWELIESYFHKDEPITLEELSMLKANLATIDKTSDGKETLGNVDTKEQVNTKINAAINALKANAPETYDTLKEIADYIANDSNAEAALLQLINTKLDKPTMSNNYYGLWDDTNKSFVAGMLYEENGIASTKLGFQVSSAFNHSIWELSPFIGGFDLKSQTNNTNLSIQDRKIVYTTNTGNTVTIPANVIGSSTVVTKDSNGLIDGGSGSMVKTAKQQFYLKSSITPTPNTLVPKTDGTRPTWYNNSSVVKEIAFLDDISGGGSTLKYYAEPSTPPEVNPQVTGANSIAIGNWAKALANDMFVYGSSAGNGATNANNSNFFGSNAGYQATGANYSNFLGENTGNGATNASYSNFLGSYAGYGATGANGSNFLGGGAGNGATNASFSNFLGDYAGNEATGAGYSNFFGNNAGNGATNAGGSNFLGSYAGYGATGANESNFIGVSAGNGATNASYSNFFGSNAGYQATNASYSNFLGFRAGYESFTGVHMGSNNIVIGTNISLGNSVSNSMNIGGVLFGTGFQSDVTGEPKITPTTNGKIGIGVTNPSEKLEVNGDVKADTYKFKLPTTITPQPNMLIPKVGGSRPTWYDNNSIEHDIAFVEDGLEIYSEDEVVTNKRWNLYESYSPNNSNIIYRRVFSPNFYNTNEEAIVSVPIPDGEAFKIINVTGSFGIFDRTVSFGESSFAYEKILWGVTTVENIKVRISYNAKGNNIFIKIRHDNDKGGSDIPIVDAPPPYINYAFLCVEYIRYVPLPPA